MPRSIATDLSKPLQEGFRRPSDLGSAIYISDGRGRYTIAQANAELDESGKFVGELIPVRRSGDIGLARPTDIELMDVSPKQLVSVAAALIPFLENDDANRALMGSNMQRQVAPLLELRPQLLVLEWRPESLATCVTIVARRAGVIDQVDATRIVVRVSEERRRTRRPLIYIAS